MIYFAMQKNLSMFLLFMFIKGIFAGTLSGSLNALIAEASGYTTRTTGVHMDGMMYSCSSLGVKVGGGIGTAAVGWLLKLGGFVGTATVQSESAIRMIFNLYITDNLIYRPFSLPDGNLRRWSGSSVSRTSRCRSK